MGVQTKVEERAVKEPTITVRGGYVLSQEAEFKLRTIVDAMHGISQLIEGDEAGRDFPEVPVSHMAAIFRMIGEATDNIRNSALLTFDEVRGRPRAAVN